MSLYDLCRVIRVILCLSEYLGVIQLYLCKYESGKMYLNNMFMRNRNEAWDVYLESVQYGLDYVLGICKCL